MEDPILTESIADIAHLHNRINVLSERMGAIATIMDRNIRPEDRQALGEVVNEANNSLAQINAVFVRERLQGRGLVSAIRKIAGQPVPPAAKFYETPATPGKAVELVTLLIGNGEGALDVPDRESPLSAALAEIDFQDLANVRYEETPAGVYRMRRDDQEAYVTILRLNDEETQNLRSFAVLPFGSGSMELRTLLPTEGIWINHQDPMFYSDASVRQAVWDLLSPNGEVPQALTGADLNTVATRALNERPAGPLSSAFTETLNEPDRSRLTLTLPIYQLTLEVVRTDGQEQYNLDFNTASGLTWSDLHPYVQSKVIAEFADYLYKVEEPVAEAAPITETVDPVICEATPPAEAPAAEM